MAKRKPAEASRVLRSHTVRLSGEEYEQLERSAMAEGKSTHAWMRDVLLQASAERDLHSQLRGLEAFVRAARRHGMLPTRRRAG